MSYNFIILTLFLSFFGCQGQNKYTRVLEPEVFKEHISHIPVQLIDVRTPREYQAGHIENAINIDLSSNNFTHQINKLDKQKPIYIYCRSGNRSTRASNELVKLGFIEIYDLKGGILRWPD